MCQETQSKLFILGAGFSKPAGLPLGNELLSEMNKYILNNESNIFDEYIKSFSGSLEAYSSFRNKKINEIEIEEFIEFLDYENFLNFSGSLSSGRGYTQDIIRFLIAKVLSEKQKNLQNGDLYEQFTSKLSENDIIISLNYDTILEKYFNSLDSNTSSIRLI
jgi:hypothetical protein